MGDPGIHWTSERRRQHGDRISEGMARARQRRRITIAAVDAFRITHEVSPALAPIVEARAAEAEQLVVDLGGDPSAAQLALVDMAQQAATVRVAAFCAWARNPESWGGKALDRFLAAARVERDALTSLGLERRQRPVPTLSDYLREQEQQRAQAAQGGTGAANADDATREPATRVDGREGPA